MKKGKKNSKKLEPDLITDEQIRFIKMNTEREQKRIKTEIQLVNIVGGVLGIGTLIFAGFAYGIELPIILFLVILSNNLCNVK